MVGCFLTNSISQCHGGVVTREINLKFRGDWFDLVRTRMALQLLVWHVRERERRCNDWLDKVIIQIWSWRPKQGIGFGWLGWVVICLGNWMFMLSGPSSKKEIFGLAKSSSLGFYFGTRRWYYFLWRLLFSWAPLVLVGEGDLKKLTFSRSNWHVERVEKSKARYLKYWDEIRLKSIWRVY